MQAFKMWVAQHPTQPENREIRFDEPVDDREYVSSMRNDEDDAFVKWQEYVCIPVGEGP